MPRFNRQAFRQLLQQRQAAAATTTAPIAAAVIPAVTTPAPIVQAKPTIPVKPTAALAAPKPVAIVPAVVPAAVPLVNTPANFGRFGRFAIPAAIPTTPSVPVVPVAQVAAAPQTKTTPIVLPRFRHPVWLPRDEDALILWSIVDFPPFKPPFQPLHRFNPNPLLPSPLLRLLLQPRLPRSQMHWPTEKMPFADVLVSK